MTVYRYGYDRSGRTFTEQEWIGRALPHFIRADYDTDATFIFFLASVFQLHLAGKTIVPVDYTEDDKPRPFLVIGCPRCHRRHTLNDNALMTVNEFHGPWSADHYRRWALKE